MSAAAVAVMEPWIPRPESHREWPELSIRAPQLVATMRRYLLQLTTFLAPRSVDAADQTLRQFARWLVANTDVAAVADITRTHIEDYKVWLAGQPGTKGRTLAKNTQRKRLRMIRIFLERLIEWDWPDAHQRNPILHGDIPPRPERSRSSSPTNRPPSSWPPPAPIISRAIDSSPRSWLAPGCAPPSCASSPPTPSPRSATPTGCAFRSASSATTGSSHCTPTSSRCSPIGPPPNSEHIRAQRRLLADGHVPIYRRTVHRIVARIGINAGIGHVHPHQLRHTLATQAINRGMRLEAIAALLGHRSLEMTLVYARIADRVVADAPRCANRSTCSTTPRPRPARCPRRSRPQP